MARGNRIRIVGGQHRGRRLAFPDAAGLRPTPDRLRETLFNWLQPVVEGSRCLDLFAGSGALGFEALSRGAAFVQFVERAPAVARRLRENLALLAEQAHASVRREDALRLLRGAPEAPYDLVFLDPPYRLEVLPEICRLLEAHGWLADRAWIFLEQESHRPWPGLPAGWVPYREARAGQAACRLVRRDKMIHSP